MNENPAEIGPATDEESHSVGWTLFTFLDVADLLRERVGTALRNVGLSFPKYEALAYLHDAGEPVSLGDLALALRCARSNITQIVDRLERDGLVRRIADPADRRSVRAELTPGGTALVQQGAARLDRLRAGFAAALGPDRAQLERLLSKLSDHRR